jgi:hypothetical protein
MTDKIYVDLLLTNAITQNNSHPRIQFFESRSIPILNDTSNYRMSITRFALNTQLLPVFIPSMQSISSSQTIYSISMTYGNNVFQQYMKYMRIFLATSASRGHPTFHAFSQTLFQY